MTTSLPGGRIVRPEKTVRLQKICRRVRQYESSREQISAHIGRETVKLAD